MSHLDELYMALAGFIDVAGYCIGWLTFAFTVKIFLEIKG